MSLANPAEELDCESAEDAVKNEIRDLEEQLARAKLRLKSRNTANVVVCKAQHHDDENDPPRPPCIPTSKLLLRLTHGNLQPS